jgi:ribose/xylose/arabinose/galactoside ABC-type transport system permease subunit
MVARAMLNDEPVSGMLVVRFDPFALGCVAAALPLLGIPGTTQSAIYGAVILVALLIDRLVRQQGQDRFSIRGSA